MLRPSAVIYLCAAILSLPTAYAETSIESFLKAFHANPKKEMDRLPDEVAEDGTLIPRGYINWDTVKETMPSRVEARDSIVGKQGWNTIGIEEGSADGKDFPEKLIENGEVVRSITELENRGLTAVNLSVAPWADSYWPMYKGVIGHRYADPRFPESGNWLVNYQYIQVNSAAGIAAFGDSASINQLSPAEKYDYVIGDSEYTLTRYAWNQGKKHHDSTGFVAKWMGICHGWAAAAHMLAPIPQDAVTVIAANGRPVTFYPQDIKALKSMLWANASPSTRFVGNRCYTYRPARNAFGRVVDPNCFDNNPGTWHLAVTNQMGIHDRSFVMDATYDAEVWNFPLVSYRYRYFNPETWKEGTSVRASMIPIERYRVDKFKEFRSPNARYVVGVYMDISHVNAISPTRRRSGDTPTKTLRFVYDLELDENLNVIGGEWYSNAHPDFIWTFDREAQALTASDRTIIRDPWSLSQPIPTHWSAAAKRASNRGAPLYSFVRWLAGPPPRGDENAEGDDGEGFEGASESDENTVPPDGENGRTEETI